MDKDKFHSYTRMMPNELEAVLKDQKKNHALTHTSGSDFGQASPGHLPLVGCKVTCCLLFKRLLSGIVFRFLGHGSSFSSHSHDFKLGRTIVEAIVYEVCEALNAGIVKQKE